LTDQLEKRLLEDVVIFGGKQQVQTGAEALAPDHSPRERYRARPLPGRGAVRIEPELQQQVEQFLFYQAELLDTKNCRLAPSKPNGWIQPRFLRRIGNS